MDVVGVVVVGPDHLVQDASALLASQGYRVTEIPTIGPWSPSRTPDAALVVLCMGAGGCEVASSCVALRSRGYRGALLVLASQPSSELQRVSALDCGADDFLSWPFSVAELFARARALLRRGATWPDARGTNLGLDHSRGSASVDGLPVTITATQFQILAHLVERRDRVVTHQSLASSIWGADTEATRNNLKAQIGRLRSRLEDARADEEIVSVRGNGYRLQRVDPA